MKEVAVAKMKVNELYIYQYDFSERINFVSINNKSCIARRRLID